MNYKIFLFAVAVLCLFTKTVSATKPVKRLSNPFFAMDTATRDAKHQTPAQQAEMLKELGYAGIGPDARQCTPEMVKACDKHGLNIFAVYCGANIETKGPKYDARIPGLIKLLKGRSSLLWLYVTSKRHKPSAVEGDDRAVAIIREIADLAEPAGVRVALYPHTGFWIERVEDAVRVTKKVERKNVGVTFNLCHFLRVGDEANLDARLKEAAPYLSIVSINGADHKGDWNRLIQPLDRGEFDVGELLRKLSAIGYTGPIGFQGYGIGGDAHENLKRTMDAWKKLTMPPVGN